MILNYVAKNTSLTKKCELTVSYCFDEDGS